MEKDNKTLEKKKLINELTQGREFVNQLKKQLGPLASPEECDLLLGKILSSLEKSLSILNLKAIILEGGINANSTSPCSSISVPEDGLLGYTQVSFLGNNNGPKSEVLDSSRDHILGQNTVSKKRKISQKWTKQVQISGTGLECPHEDGYSWRKYGQKDILGANHPRAYYRCTHRNTQGCLATKQVQRSDENSSTFEVTYKGRHSCKVAQSEIFSVENKRLKQNKKQCQQQKQELSYHRQEQDMVIFNYELNHKVENFNLTKEEVFTPFSFPPTTPLNQENIEEAQFFSYSMEPFSLGTTQNEEFGMSHLLQSSESDLTELISTPTSISNSPFGGDWDLSVDFEPSLTFDITDFLN